MVFDLTVCLSRRRRRIVLLVILSMKSDDDEVFFIDDYFSTTRLVGDYEDGLIKCVLATRMRIYCYV